MRVRGRNTVPTLGQLKRVDVHEVWAHEVNSATPWLTREENPQLLGETITLQLVLEVQEEPVGMFRAAILARAVHTGHRVLMENQLERTDHEHLGQFITSASGLKAVSSLFTDEHRAVLDWLNEIPDSRSGFFGLEMQRLADHPEMRKAAERRLTIAPA
jgi:hypothetical protein